MLKVKISNLINAELASAILLTISFLLALFFANTPYFNKFYHNFVYFPIHLGIGETIYKIPVIQLINDGLMTLFFLLIGIELKFHLVRGEYQNKKLLILPSAAAVGGIIFPAAIYLAFNFNNDLLVKGWAIPIATDTAFMLAILSFFGNHISTNLRAFIIGFSLIDDAIALTILAIYYTDSPNQISSIIFLLLVVLLLVLNRLKITNMTNYFTIGFFLWISMIYAGFHGTLAGVVLALAIPVEIDNETNPSFVKLEHNLRPLVFFVILPIFAFSNSGVSISNFSIDMLTNNLAYGIIFGLFLGKQIGIFSFTFFSVKMNWCSLPENVSWTKFYAISILSGIGFTLSLFIGDLSFDDENAHYIMKISVIIGSLMSAFYGTIIMYLSKFKRS